MSFSGCRWRRWNKLTMLLAAAVTPVLSVAAEERARPATPHQRLLLDMGDHIVGAVARKDTAHPVFHGCIDWHSAVHGHWALLRVARTVKERTDLAAWVDQSLGRPELADEADYVRRRPRFEMPYGRAWFLRLAVEHECWRNEHPELGESPLRPFADEVAQSLADYYDRRQPSPQSREYGNDAWALVQLHDFYKHRGAEEERRRVERLVDEYFLNNPAKLGFETDFRSPEFFSRFGNWSYLIAHAKEPAQLERFWQARRPTDEALRPVKLIDGNDHHLGVNWSRAWAIRSVSRSVSDEQERARLDAAYREHVNAGAAAHRQFSRDYGAYGHWVPQFAVYALTE